MLFRQTVAAFTLHTRNQRLRIQSVVSDRACAMTVEALLCFCHGHQAAGSFQEVFRIYGRTDRPIQSLQSLIKAHVALVPVSPPAVYIRLARIAESHSPLDGNGHALFAVRDGI